jgi:N-acetylglucosaminyl-diphospho-decaprenol L-rhamnosyltransferase
VPRRSIATLPHPDARAAAGLVVLTVAYRSGAALPGLARDLARQSERPRLWLLIDNSPCGDPLDAAPLQQAADLPIALLRGEEGDGFGVGCNRGLEHLAATGWPGWVWLLNPDTSLPDPHTLAALRQRLAALPATALVGTAVDDGAGGLEPSGGWFSPGLAFRRHRLGPADAAGATAASAPLAVDWLSGCSLALRPAAHEPPARFDPAFPLYYEDMDLCLRLGRAGAPVLWLAQPRIEHRRGSGSEAPGPRRLRLSSVSYLRFLRRHCSPWAAMLRHLRLLLLTLLRLPLRPQRSLAVLAAVAESLRAPA